MITIIIMEGEKNIFWMKIKLFYINTSSVKQMTETDDWNRWL